jgi:hypothetical protein
MEKETEASNKLFVQVKKIKKGGSLILSHSVGLEIVSVRKPIFQLIQINQAPMMNVSMKKLLLWCSFACSALVRSGS